MTSRIGVMYQEARNTVRSAPVKRIENFLTEMLSLSVLADWRPVAALLANVAPVRDHPAIASIRPYTQQQVVAGDSNFDRGRIDLALAIDWSDGTSGEVWLEVKAGSPFSGDQIERYLKAIKDAKKGEDPTRRRLVVLGPTGTEVPRQYCDDVPVLTWADLVHTVRQSANTSLLWADFADFLQTAPGNLVPQQPVPHGALSADWIARTIEVVMKNPVAWCNWGRGRVLTQVRNHKATFGRPCIQRWAPWQMTYIELGSTKERPTALSVRLCLGCHYGIPYEALWRRAEASSLRARGWTLGTRRREEDVILETSRPFHEGEDTVQEAGDWMRTQLEALGKADLLLNLDGDGVVRGDSEHAPYRHEAKARTEP